MSHYTYGRSSLLLILFMQSLRYHIPDITGIKHLTIVLYNKMNIPPTPQGNRLRIQIVNDPLDIINFIIPCIPNF
jgi:hypothetical protein